MSKKSVKKAAKPLNAKLRDLVTTAAAIGYDVMGGFARAVVLARSIGQGNKLALVEAGLQYKAGYIVRYSEDDKNYLRRTGNMDQGTRFEDALLTYAKAGPETAKPNRRTAAENKACRAADVSWRQARVRAFNIQPKARKPRPASTESNPVPVDLVKASPKLANKEAANDYFATAAAALLTTCNVNSAKKSISPQISSAVSDFHAAIKALGLIS